MTCDLMKKLDNYEPYTRVLLDGYLLPVQTLRMASDILSSRLQQDLCHTAEQLNPINPPPASLVTDVEKNGLLPMESETIVDRFEVTFDGPTDTGNPLNWSKRTKWTATLLLAITGFNSIMVSTTVAVRNL